MQQIVEKRDVLSMLVPKLWLDGYHILSRKFGKYLPEPAPVGTYDVDIVAKKGNSFAIGLCLSGAEVNDPALLAKIKYLATRKAKYSNQAIRLYIGVEQVHYMKLSLILKRLESDERKNIRSFALDSQPAPTLFQGAHQLPERPVSHFV